MDALGNYYGNELGSDLVNRYKYLGSSVTFMVRVKRISDEETLKMTKIDVPGFSVVEIPEFNSIKDLIFNRKRILQIIDGAIQNHNLLIARLPSFVGRQAIDVANKYSKAVLVEAVGCPWDALSHHSISGKLLAPWAYFQMRRYIAKAPFVIYVTQKFLQHRYPNNQRNLGISDVIIRQSDDDVPGLRYRRIMKRVESGELLKLATIAGLDASFKGQDIVIKALAGLKKDGFSAKYYLVGRGNGFTLKRLAKVYNIENDVVFMGELPHHTVFSFLDDIDVYIQPSKQEGLPRALVEAMSRGCTCLGTRAGGIPELLDDDMLFDPDTISDLQQKLKGMNVKTLIDEAQRNISFAQSFHPDVLNKRRNEFYKEFLFSNGLLTKQE